MQPDIAGPTAKLPSSADMRGTTATVMNLTDGTSMTPRLPTPANVKGDEIDLTTKARIESDALDFHVTFTKTLRKNGELIRERTWVDRIPRMYQ